MPTESKPECPPSGTPDDRRLRFLPDNGRHLRLVVVHPAADMSNPTSPTRTSRRRAVEIPYERDMPWSIARIYASERSEPTTPGPIRFITYDRVIRRSGNMTVIDPPHPPQ